MSSAAVRAVPSTNPSARVASRFGGDEDEESDFDCRESSIASTTSATSVASGTRIFRADATTASAEAEGRIPPIPRASAVFGATAEANPRSHRYESRIEKVSVRLCSTSAWRKICWEGTTRWYFSCDYVGVRRGPGDRPIRVRDKRTRLFQLVPVGKLSALQTPAARGGELHSHRTRPVATMAQVGPLERRTRARDGLAGGNAFARSAETARTVPRVRVARACPRSGRATPRDLPQWRSPSHGRP